MSGKQFFGYRYNWLGIAYKGEIIAVSLEDALFLLNRNLRLIGRWTADITDVWRK